MNNQFGELLRKARKESLSLTQNTLGQMIGLRDGSMISRFERGESTPDEGQLQAIIEALIRSGLPSERAERLKEIYTEYASPFTRTADPTISFIAQAKKRLPPKYKEGFHEAIVEFTTIYRDRSQALWDNNQRKWKSARSRLEALDVSQTEFDGAFRRPSYEAWGDACYSEGVYVDAIKHYKKALAITQSLQGHNHPISARIHIKLGDTHRRLADWRRSNSSYKTSKEISLKLVDKRHYANTLRKIAGTYLFEGQPSKALDLCEESLALCKKADYAKAHYKGLFHKAWALRLLGYWSLSTDMAKEALELLNETELEETERKWELLKAYRYLGDAYHIQRKTAAAIEVYQKAEAIIDQFKEMGPEPKLLAGTVWGGLGHAYVKMGKNKEAEEYLRKGLDLHRELSEGFRTANMQQKLGDLSTALDNYLDAEVLLDEALLHLEFLGNPFHYANALYDRARLHYKQGEFNSFAELMSLAMEAEKTAEEGLLHIHIARFRLISGKIQIAKHHYSQTVKEFHSAMERALIFPDPLFLEEVLVDIQATIDQLFRTREYRALISISGPYDSLSAEGAGHVKQELLQEFLTRVQNRKIAVERFI